MVWHLTLSNCPLELNNISLNLHLKQEQDTFGPRNDTDVISSQRGAKRDEI